MYNRNNTIFRLIYLNSIQIQLIVILAIMSENVQTYVPSEDADHPVHSHSLIRIFLGTHFE